LTSSIQRVTLRKTLKQGEKKMNESQLGTGLPKMVDRCIEEMSLVLNSCQPFNDFDAEENADFSTVCRREAAKIVELIDTHDSINRIFKVRISNA
jgi:hypothetical protein